MDDQRVGDSPDITVLDGVAAMIWVLAGPEHRVVAANRAAEAELQTGSPLRAVLAPANSAAADLCDDVLRTGRPVVGRHRWRGDGDPVEERNVTLVAAPREADGAVEGCLLQAFEVDQPSTGGAAAVPALAALAAVPGYDLAARYVAAADRERAGGDWFEAVGLPDGRLAVAVGDLVGAGAPSAIAMLRGVLMSALLSGDDVDAVLRRLDLLAERVPEAGGSTVTVVVLDPVAQELRFASAGHPLPILVAGEGGAKLLAGPRGMPLAVPAARATPHSVPLATGDALVLYTDGMLGEHGRTSRSADPVLLTAADEARDQRLSCADLCDRILGAMLPAPRSARDDAVVLVVRAGKTATVPFRLDLPAEPAELAVVRKALDEWMTGAGMSQEDATALQLAVGEAVGNSVEHAYVGRDQGRVVVTAERRGDGMIRVDVSDTGRWRNIDPAENVHRGRGLQLIRASVGEMRLIRSAAGTTVRMLYRLSNGDGEHRAVESSWVGTDHIAVEVMAGGTPLRVRLSGELDAVNAESVSRELQRVSRGGSLALWLDLADLEYLDSFGVRILFELASSAQTTGERLAVTAPKDSVVERVLLTAGFDQLAEMVPG
ncbi:SpoIIE family protein phosphatase [Amycolatopsis nigrescens]|uniref:SpoIIE family protein phosphatase n=1 Tax=Amycolatopsis nigrescens TaxID=381445 RepID=UPI0012FC8825|nr:SpoIIE family protein phosphatase [Amycolatopsis nigrescens]